MAAAGGALTACLGIAASRLCQSRMSSFGKISLKEIVEYRKISADAREHFLEYLSAMQHKINSQVNTEQAIKKMIDTEIIPAVRKFKNQLEAISNRFKILMDFSREHF